MNIKTILMSVVAVAAFSSTSMAEDHVVEIKGFKFVPAEVSAVQGDTITFVNLDSAPHSVVQAPDTEVSFVESPIMATGATYTLLVEDTGLISAKCGVHPGMPGVLISSTSKSEKLIFEIREKLNELEVVLHE